MLEIKKLDVKIDKKTILKDLSLKIKQGEVVAIMGPNGAGKTTLANAIMGNKKFQTNGNIILDDEELIKLNTDERAKKGLFMSFQHPSEISGVTLRKLLFAILKKRDRDFSFQKFNIELEEKTELLKIKKEFLDRSLNQGFSGGEKKKAEILQLLILKPKYAILDETDSGLDIDALRIVAENINFIRQETNIGLLIITHYPRLLELIKPNKVLILQKGHIVNEGGPELAYEIEKKGFES